MGIPITLYLGPTRERIFFNRAYDGIDFDKNNCISEVREYRRGEYEIRVEYSQEEKSKNCGKRITFSYIKDIDWKKFELLKKEIDTLDSYIKLKNDYNVGEDTHRDCELEERLNSEIFMYRFGVDFLTGVTINSDNKLGIKECIQWLYDYAVDNLPTLQEEYKQVKDDIETCEPEGSLVLPGVDIVYARNMLTGGIHISNGGIILFTAQLDENDLIHNIKLNRYESLVDIAYSMDEDDVKLDYLCLSEKALESDGILPISSISLDFDELLLENNMSDYSEKPITAIYKLKDILASKVLEYEDSKKR